MVDVCCLHPQEVIVCKDNDKPRLLGDHLLRGDEKRVIVFVNTKTHCDAVSRQLDQLGFSCTVLHGGKTQASFLTVTLAPTPPPAMLSEARSAA